MADAKPTMLGHLKRPEYFYGHGDTVTRVRCDKCGAKYTKEDNKKCPECDGKGKPTE